jgi:hypothetical protein
MWRTSEQGDEGDKSFGVGEPAEPGTLMRRAFPNGRAYHPERKFASQQTEPGPRWPTTLYTYSTQVSEVSSKGTGKR